MTNVPTGASAPITSTASGGRPTSSWASRSAVSTSVSPSSRRPPGNEISPAWRAQVVAAAGEDGVQAAVGVA